MKPSDLHNAELVLHDVDTDLIAVWKRGSTQVKVWDMQSNQPARIISLMVQSPPSRMEVEEMLLTMTWVENH